MRILCTEDRKVGIEHLGVDGTDSDHKLQRVQTVSASVFVRDELVASRNSGGVLLNPVKHVPNAVTSGRRRLYYFLVTGLNGHGFHGGSDKFQKISSRRVRSTWAQEEVASGDKLQDNTIERASER